MDEKGLTGDALKSERETPTGGTRWRLPYLCLSFAILLVSCRVLHQTAALPAKSISVIIPDSKSKTIDPVVLQNELQRYCDTFMERNTAAIKEYGRAVGSPEARRQALIWQASLASASLGIASGPNPTANLLDFISLASISRMRLEVLSRSTNGAAFVSWFETSRVLETNAWKLADGVLTAKQQLTVQEYICRSGEENSAADLAFFDRVQDFRALIKKSGQDGKGNDSLLGLVGLDPATGLDPAVREVTLSRLFAERVMFTAQRIPFLLRWHVEILADQLLHQSEVDSMIQIADRLSRAAESLSQTAAPLPDRLSAEREAILDALETQEGKLRALSSEVGNTLNAGEKMSASLTTTIKTLDALMKRFGVGEPPTGPPNTNSRPFNILDYAQTAEQLASAARELDVFLKDAGTMLDSPVLATKVQSVSVGAQADLKSVLDHAFLLAAGLVLLTFSCALAYRKLNPRPRL